MAQHILLRDKNILEIRPQNYIPGKKYPTVNFHHGIGEAATSASNNTLDEFSEFHRFLDKWADGLAGEETIFILPQDQDGKVTTTGQVLTAWKWADQYTDGRKAIGGLSMGAGETMEQFMSSLYANYPDATFIFPICFPSWESLDEKYLANDKRPFWAFIGVKDAAVSISTFVNTIGDIIAAGRKEGTNFYVSIYPNRDHFIWTSVMGSVVPVSPNTGALDANGKSIYGLKSYPGLPDWVIVNDPAITPMKYFLMQQPGDYKPLPRLSDAQPSPAPTPTSTATKYFKNFIQTGPRVYKITWLDTNKQVSFESFKISDSDELKEQYTNNSADGRQYFKITTVNGVVKIFSKK